MEFEYLSQYFKNRLSVGFLQDRVAIENANEAKNRLRAEKLSGLKKLTSRHFLIEWILKLSGAYWLGARSARRIQKKLNVFNSPRVPPAFDGYTILHLSDLHADISEPAMEFLCDQIRSETCDLCVMTGDYRGKTWGQFDDALKIMGRIGRALHCPVYAVLGNHDSIEMVPSLEAMGIKVLLNETVSLERGEAKLHLAGVDDAHFFGLHDLKAVLPPTTPNTFSILLSHTPELYGEAADANFDVMLSGHTHAGQICLPGGIPLRLDCNVPRRMGAGRWQHGKLSGYTSAGAGTSIVPVRLNCRPEITLHRLAKA
ncbi:MAG: metallophosphoesterase [Aestuariivirga sp.]